MFPEGNAARITDDVQRSLWKMASILGKNPYVGQTETGLLNVINPGLDALGYSHIKECDYLRTLQRVAKELYADVGVKAIAGLTEGSRPIEGDQEDRLAVKIVAMLPSALSPTPPEPVVLPAPNAPDFELQTENEEMVPGNGLCTLSYYSKTGQVPDGTWRVQKFTGGIWVDYGGASQPTSVASITLPWLGGVYLNNELRIIETGNGVTHQGDSAGSKFSYFLPLDFPPALTVAPMGLVNGVDPFEGIVFEFKAWPWTVGQWANIAGVEVWRMKGETYGVRPLWTNTAWAFLETIDYAANGGVIFTWQDMNPHDASPGEELWYRFVPIGDGVVYNNLHSMPPISQEFGIVGEYWSVEIPPAPKPQP